MDMYFSAKTQTLTQFKELYDKRLLNEAPKIGSPVIFCAMANQTISQPKFTDEELAPLYDAIFQNCTLEVNIKNDWGYTPIELARKLPYRADLLKRMG